MVRIILWCGLWGRGIYVVNNMRYEVRLIVVFAFSFFILSLQSAKVLSDTVKPREVVDFKAIDPIDPSGKPIHIKDSLNSFKVKGADSLFLFQGIPSDIELSEGLRKNGVWSVPYAKINNLKLVYPSGCSITFCIRVSLYEESKKKSAYKIFSVNINANNISKAGNETCSPLMRCRVLLCPDATKGCKAKYAIVEPKKFTISNIIGKSGYSIPLNINTKEIKTSEESLLLFKGIPKHIKLNVGVFRENLWSAPFEKAGKLSIMIPKNYKGKFDVDAYLFKDGESAPERVIFSVIINSQFDKNKGTPHITVPPHLTNYSASVTKPAPTVLPPSRMAKRIPFSRPTGLFRAK